jgi:hypothetical protein
MFGIMRKKGAVHNREISIDVAGKSLDPQQSPRE